ncbi:MAG: hypothetical protein P8Y18_06655 [Candidatus Bathyarchaeota archaeon]
MIKLLELSFSMPWKLIRLRKSGRKPVNGCKCSICENKSTKRKFGVTETNIVPNIFVNSAFLKYGFNVCDNNFIVVTNPVHEESNILSYWRMRT